MVFQMAQDDLIDSGAKRAGISLNRRRDIKRTLLLDLPELLTIEQVADRFGVKPRFVRSLISRNQIAYKRLGAKTIRITRDALIDYLDKIDVAPPQPAIDDSEYSSLKSTVKRNRSLKSKDETVKGMGDYGDRLSQEMRDQWRS